MIHLHLLPLARHQMLPYRLENGVATMNINLVGVLPLEIAENPSAVDAIIVHGHDRTLPEGIEIGARIDSREQSDGKKKIEKPADVPVSAESTSVPPKPANASTKLTGKSETIISDDVPDEERLKVLFGFSGFDSTKGKTVEDNLTTAATGACRKDTKREYRQYMNRLGGFNRPLDKR
uniref:U4/U6.U5 small nuclear ribonucleoprotein 27 kDa protein putative n=1 Tax=Albugo laibachii Nc14 TaxID=890382 RepID=F0WA79_9STRA|nr:U4/U6.U5 small nuclear ribonucleoprotein 27 kDa protein putative [Albugo laibachii Nc14]|eukprot:CCA18049.1 U4/U6.U5 small nuclear ribonucleoprotein 27 kDa protein putative [Albugo laibachii Nc14]